MEEKNYDLENPGIDPGTSRMQSGRSTIWANTPLLQDNWRKGISTSVKSYIK